MSDVLVVGAGPVGLTMASELARHGIRCRIVDRMEIPLPYCRAIGVTPRTLEVWDDMGVAREMVDAGLWLEGMRSYIDGHPVGDTAATFDDLPYSELGLPQYETERLLGRHLARFGIAVERGVALSELVQDGTGVAARLEHADGSAENARFRYVVGCDGAHSAVRHALGIGFPGEAFPMGFMLGDVRIEWDLPRGMALRALRLNEDAAPDMFIAIPLPEAGRYRVSMLAPEPGDDAAGTDHGIQTEAKGPDLAAIAAVAAALLPELPPISDLRWSSYFRISMRLADRYRDGRVFIAGDAAHIHPPTGGQGMNTGIQDAYNLAWKLALVLQRAAPETLLDSYESERRPVGADVVQRTRAASENYGRAKGEKPDRLADTQILVSYRGGDFVTAGEPPLPAHGPAPGDRAPDAAGLRRRGIGFPVRLFDILRGTDHVLLVQLGDAGETALAELGAFAADLAATYGTHVRLCAIAPADVAWQPLMPLCVDAEGSFAAAYGPGETAVLVRPDGYVGWRGRSWRDATLGSHLAKIFTA
ncbi:monooxygenase [Acuticoccus sediminis]|uniref:Monooxygenase n=1 Tax=Acuticoccus sediminis TaxID=2184697 RepID=A0A8B2NKP5_9HYPH|nr:FAD-dependent monooxygenase [Acuticoccus sediminis]RAH99057.1 monooxygenase [Acuticoccus sediminis]